MGELKKAKNNLIIYIKANVRDSAVVAKGKQNQNEEN